MDEDATLLADCWQTMAQEMFGELKGLANSLRQDIPGFIGYRSVSASYNVQEGYLQIFFEHYLDGTYKARATLAPGPDCLGKELGIITLAER